MVHQSGAKSKPSERLRSAAGAVRQASYFRLTGGRSASTHHAVWQCSDRNDSCKLHLPVGRETVTLAENWTRDMARRVSRPPWVRRSMKPRDDSSFGQGGPPCRARSTSDCEALPESFQNSARSESGRTQTAMRAGRRRGWASAQMSACVSRSSLTDLLRRGRGPLPEAARRSRRPFGSCRAAHRASEAPVARGNVPPRRAAHRETLGRSLTP
jgi:hypothetical protein